MTDRDNRLKELAAITRADRHEQVPKSNTPQYKERDLHPPMGGKSLLHDSNGRRLSNPYQSPTYEDTRQGLDRVLIRGGAPPPQGGADHPLQQRQLSPTRSVQDVQPPQERTVHYNTPDPVELAGGSSIPAHVGVHEEHRWYDNKVTGPKKSDNAREYVDNNYVNSTGLQDVDHNVISTTASVDGEIHHVSDSTNPPPNLEQYHTPDPQLEQRIEGCEPSDFSENSVRPGEYCIVVDGIVISTSSSVLNISNKIEEIMFEYKVPIESISVFNKLHINVGIIIK